MKYTLMRFLAFIVGIAVNYFARSIHIDRFLVICVLLTLGLAFVVLKYVSTELYEKHRFLSDCILFITVGYYIGLSCL